MWKEDPFLSQRGPGMAGYKIPWWGETAKICPIGGFESLQRDKK